MTFLKDLVIAIITPYQQEQHRCQNYESFYLRNEVMQESMASKTVSSASHVYEHRLLEQIGARVTQYGQRIEIKDMVKKFNSSLRPKVFCTDKNT